MIFRDMHATEKLKESNKVFREREREKKRREEKNNRSLLPPGYNHLYANTWASVCPLHSWSGGGVVFGGGHRCPTIQQTPPHPPKHPQHTHALLCHCSVL